MATSPTQRTLKYLKDLGYITDIVERWIPIPSVPGGGNRKDFLGIIDILAIDKEEGRLIGVQSTGQAFKDHYVKITTEGREMASLWLSLPCTELHLYGWRKVKKKRGGKQMIWSPRIHKFKKEEL